MNLQTLLLVIAICAIHAYEIISCIGSGSSGKTFLAKTLEGQNVILKTVTRNRTNLVQRNDKSSYDITDFENEVLILSAISKKSPKRIVKFLGSFNSTLVLEYVAGKDLMHKVENVKFSSILLEMSLALQETHALGYCHRDIKPENFMWSNEQKVKLIDFGVAMQIGEYRYVRGATPYKSPEAIVKARTEAEGGKMQIDCRASDVWSLGVSFYRVLQGVELFAKATNGVQDFEKTTESILGGDIDLPADDWNHLLKMMLRRDANERMKLDEVVNYLNRIDQEES